MVANILARLRHQGPIHATVSMESFPCYWCQGPSLLQEEVLLQPSAVVLHRLWPCLSCPLSLSRPLSLREQRGREAQQDPLVPARPNVSERQAIGSVLGTTMVHSLVQS